MKPALALSVVYPAGDWIRSGKKTLEIRQWCPDSVPLRDLVIVQNKVRLSSSGIAEDPNGKAVAIVDIESVADWQESQIEEACATYWEYGWKAWQLTNIRPVHSPTPVPAKLRIYPIEWPNNAP